MKLIQRECDWCGCHLKEAHGEHALCIHHRGMFHFTVYPSYKYLMYLIGEHQ